MWSPQWHGGGSPKSSPGSPVSSCLFFWWVFPIAVPLFMFSFLSLQSRIGWLLSFDSNGGGLGYLLLSFPMAA